MRRRATPGPLLAAIALAVVLAPIVAPSPVGAIGGPLPPCRITDVMTAPRSYADWSTTLVDWTFSVGKDYKPPDLVPVADAGLPGGGLIRKIAIPDLRALASAARANGTPIADFVSYRSYKTQAGLFTYYVNGYGYAAAITYAQRPGHSEHQLGTTIDFMAQGAGGMLSGDSAAGRWMAKNAWKYGWILSYPDGKQAIVCLHYEPWHYRYFGRDLAAKIHASGLTSREYLWEHFTTIDPTTGLPIPTASPSQGSSAAPSATAPSPSVPPAGATNPLDTPPASQAPAAPAGDTNGLGFPLLLIGVVALLAIVAVTIWRTGLRRRGGSGGAATSR